MQVYCMLFITIDLPMYITGCFHKDFGHAAIKTCNWAVQIAADSKVSVFGVRDMADAGVAA